jgi:hypothetical protein
MNKKTLKMVSSENWGGSNHVFEFENATQEIVDTLNTRARVWFNDENFTLTISCSNKREVADIDLWFEKITAPAVEPKTETIKNQTRYIELLSIAVENGLNHGRSWVATATNVDEHGLSPWFDGEQICYIYN